MPPKTTRRHKQGFESREKILRAALDVASERGYDGATLARVTKMAGLPASSVYWQFKDKDSLLAEALDFSYGLWRSQEPRWQPEDGLSAPREHVAAKLVQSVQSVLAEPAFWRFGLMLALVDREKSNQARAQYIAIRENTRNLIEQWWRAAIVGSVHSSGRAPAQLASFYLALIDGMLISNRSEHHEDLQLIAERLAPALTKAALGGSAQAVTPAYRPLKDRRTLTAQGAVVEVQDSRSRILMAAAASAAEFGYRGTTIAHISRLSGLPPGSIYWHFKDKAHLFSEMVRFSWREWESAQEPWAAPGEGQTWQEALSNILSQSVASLVDAPTFIRVGHLLVLENLGEIEAVDGFLAARSEARAIVGRWFSDHVLAADSADPADIYVITELIIMITDGFFLTAHLEPRDANVDNFVSLTVDIISEIVADASGRLCA